MAAKIKTKDQVIVIAGSNKGSTGVVSKIFTKTNRVLITGVNMISKHVKKNPSAGVEGGIIKKEASIAISNVALLDPKTKKPTRIGFKLIAQGEGKPSKKVRYAKASGELIDLS
ncbi:MAG: 50S ribosomal protein L24 [Gammaproteobacteria bacterium RIFCSPHIGHO2_12_FULL_41_15]|nr:MAG: 50S ribosomal protein L24 [Gammaproteobacteria bacterium RIFCSPHIGHO2_12_FULL_41_15]